MAVNLNLTPPKVQEQIVFSNPNPNPFPANATPAFNSPPPSTITPASHIKPIKVKRHHNDQTPIVHSQSTPSPKSHPKHSSKHSSKHHNSSKHRHSSKHVDEPPAVPSDFANLVNADKIKIGTDTQTLLAKEDPQTKPAQPIKRNRADDNDKSDGDDDSDDDSDDDDNSDGDDDGVKANLKSGGGGHSDESDGSDSEDDGGGSSGSDSDRSSSKNGRKSGKSQPLPPLMVDKDAMFEKTRILARLARRQRMYPANVVEFNNDMTLAQLQQIDATASYESQADMSIQVMKRGILFLVGLSERASVAYPQMGMDLDGWAEHVFLTLQQYDETLFDIYDQYGSMVKMDPILRLTMSLATNAWMFSITKTLMERRGTMPNTTKEELNAAIDAAKKAAAAQTPNEPQTSSAPQTQTQTQTQTKRPVHINASAMRPPSSALSSELDPAQLMKMLASDSKTNVRKVDVSMPAKKQQQQQSQKER